MRAEAGSLLERFFLDHPRFDYIYIYIYTCQWKSLRLLAYLMSLWTSSKTTKKDSTILY